MTKRPVKTIRKPFGRRIIKWVLIPCLLLLLWVFFGVIYSSYKSFTVIQYPYYKDQNNNFSNEWLLKGKKISAAFVAKEDNLGIVELRLGNVPTVDYEVEDVITFKLKEKGDKAWLYENTYKSGAMDSNSFYPFGFEPIKDSKGKTYVFEIQSQNGTASNAIRTGRSNLAYFSKYKFTKDEVFSNNTDLLEFVYKKIFTFFTNIDALLSSSVFLLPFSFYIAWKSFGKKGPSRNALFSSSRSKIKGRVIERNLFTIIVLVLIFADIFFSEGLTNGFMLGLLGLWIINIYLTGVTSKVTFTLAFIIITLSVISIYFHWSIFIDKSSAFGYFLIVIGFVQSMVEIRKKPTKTKKRR